MKYILITKNENLNFPNVQSIYPRQSLYIQGAIDSFNKVDSIAIDIETTGLNPWTDKILLIALYNPKFPWTLIIDLETVDINILHSFNLDKKLILAHNIQFEASFLGVKGIKITRAYCTMVAEAKLMQGSSHSVALQAVLERRQIPLPEGMDKDTRLDFIQDDFHLEEKHIIYNASDVLALHTLKDIQKDNIETFNLNYFINSIHNPLALILNDIKLEGFVFDSKKWIANANNIEEVCNQYVSFLNDKVMPLVNWTSINSDVVKEKEKKERGIIRTTARIVKLKAGIELKRGLNKTHLKTYKTEVESLTKAEIDLVNYNMITFDNYIGINWSSSKQVLEALTQLGVTPLPQSKSATTHRMQPSASSAAREAWLLENPDHKWFQVMDIFNSYKNKLHLVNSFGRKWVDKYMNPLTGKVHTSYRQNAATGRLTSGNADEGLYNSQQIPQPNEFRTCFGVEEGYSVATLDYSGAELCFMAATAEDDKLIELSKGDMHSYFANKGWAAILGSRGYDPVSENIISKTQNKHLRTGYKPMMFGVVYGLRAKKAAETLNVTVKEGQIAINTIIKEIPKTIAMVEAASKFALINGYVVHNDRTNSRRWFSDVLASNALGTELSFILRSNVESTARNTRIQGSQADMIMEAIVTCSRWIKLNKIDAAILGTVHDEIIFKFKDELTWFPERAKELMERVAAKYMKGMLVLKADVETEKTWIK